MIIEVSVEIVFGFVEAIAEIVPDIVEIVVEIIREVNAGGVINLYVNNELTDTIVSTNLNAEVLNIFI